MPRPRSSIARVLLGMVVAVPLIGCGSSGGDFEDVQPVPGTITAAQADSLPLEEADDLTVRQNLSEPRPVGLPGKDSPLPADERVK